ncbi:MAG: DapH/DapD/GlmU-related protein [Lachnospiraceae bacterium]
MNDKCCNHGTQENNSIDLYFVGENPSTSFNSSSVYPQIDDSAFISPFSSVIGDVKIEKNVFLGCNVTVRADEGSPFHIGCNANLQDGVILHGLRDVKYTVGNKEYSIYVGDEASIAHGALLHGPCVIGDRTFVGFNSVVFNAIVESDCYIDVGAIITNGVTVASHKYVPLGAIIDSQEKADALCSITEDKQAFAEKVVKVNTELADSFTLKFGDTRCSCGICCDGETLPKKEKNASFSE